ncbi:hypothetical protein CEXT_648551 [Caerostris extrusa]|uniref:Uncharacterized protein n=1 Tax=Caerostris extrusa TaxID=172846 RepID=A0AAV4V4N6_CAEEX|nr:hypothetical protein CEXT_648551 [Caerostris extrusa]
MRGAVDNGEVDGTGNYTSAGKKTRKLRRSPDGVQICQGFLLKTKEQRLDVVERMNRLCKDVFSFTQEQRSYFIVNSIVVCGVVFWKRWRIIPQFLSLAKMPAICQREVKTDPLVLCWKTQTIVSAKTLHH